MKTKLTVLFLIFLALWGTYDLYTKYHQAQVGIQKGNQAPDITLNNLNGKTTHLSDYKGDLVIVNFWATWCSPCKQEIPVIRNFYSENQNKKIVVLGVNAASTEKNKQNVIQFSKKNHINYPVLLDEQGKYADMFQVTGYPTTYIINANGIIQDKYVGQIDDHQLKSILSQTQ